MLTAREAFINDAKLRLKKALLNVRKGEGIEIARCGKGIQRAMIFEKFTGNKWQYKRKMSAFLLDAINRLRDGQTISIKILKE
jgi:hypothetical protein